MEITDIHSFLKYYSRIKERTIRLFSYIPKDKMEWTYQEGKFTIGDIIRHLANIERFMYAETVQQLPNQYNGCGIEFAEGYQETIDYYNKKHRESVDIFSKLTTEDLQRKCTTPAGIQITTWKWLRAMVEHEIHHRGQIYIYLGMLEVITPPVFGLTSEELIVKS